MHRRADGAKLRRLRQERGWSQEELAHHADLSERLVRKAESSAPLRRSTLIQLAQALSKSGCGVDPADLAPTENNILIGLVESLFDRKNTTLPRTAKLLHPPLRTFVAGNADTIPFAGTFHGLVGFVELRKILRATLTSFERLSKSTEWFVEAGRFSMWCDVQLALSDPSHLVTIWFAIHSPSESELYIHFDTEMMAQAIRRQQ